MLKIYEAKSQVNLNVNLPGGGYVHVSFAPKTGGGSVYYTRDKLVQAGLERNARFNKIYRLGKVVDESAKAETEVKEAVPEKIEPKVLKMEFRNNDDAKEWMADKYGISRSKLRSRDAIEKAAREHKIEIVWI